MTGTITDRDGINEPKNGLLEGKRLGDFTIGNVLGVGGQACVYEATHDYLPGSNLAIKVPFREDEATEREALNWLGLWQYPNILALHFIDKPEGRTVFVMERGIGSLKDKTLPGDKVLRVAAAVADALRYAHSKNIAHMDVKPGNIIELPGGRYALSDFGISSGLGQSALASTPLYRAPEATGKWNTVEQKAGDIYSFALTLIALCCGKADWLPGVPGLKILQERKDLQGMKILTPKIFDFIRRCLDVNPLARPSAVELTEIFPLGAPLVFDESLLNYDEKLHCNYNYSLTMLGRAKGPIDYTEDDDISNGTCPEAMNNAMMDWYERGMPMAEYAEQLPLKVEELTYRWEKPHLARAYENLIRNRAVKYFPAQVSATQEIMAFHARVVPAFEALIQADAEGDHAGVKRSADLLAGAFADSSPNERVLRDIVMRNLSRVSIKSISGGKNSVLPGNRDITLFVSRRENDRLFGQYLSKDMQISYINYQQTRSPQLMLGFIDMAEGKEIGSLPKQSLLLTMDENMGNLLFYMPRLKCFLLIDLSKKMLKSKMGALISLGFNRLEGLITRFFDNTHILDGRTSRVKMHACISPDGGLLVHDGRFGLLVLKRLYNGTQANVKEIFHVVPLFFHPDGKSFFAVVYQKGHIVHRISVDTREVEFVYALPFGCVPLAASPGGETLWCADVNGTLYVLELRNGEVSVAEAPSYWRLWFAAGLTLVLSRDGSLTAFEWDGTLRFRYEHAIPEEDLPLCDKVQPEYPVMDSFGRFLLYLVRYKNATNPNDMYSKMVKIEWNYDVPTEDSTLRLQRITAVMRKAGLSEAVITEQLNRHR